VVEREGDVDLEAWRKLCSLGACLYRREEGKDDDEELNSSSLLFPSPVFVCLAALSILDALDSEVDSETLGWWLAERQLPNGGLNGRPEKLEDVSFNASFSLSLLPSLRDLG